MKSYILLCLLLPAILLSGCVQQPGPGGDIEQIPESELLKICKKESWPSDCSVVPDQQGKTLCEKCKELGYATEDVGQMPESELRELCESESWPPDCSIVPDSVGREMCEKCKELSGIEVQKEEIIEPATLRQVTYLGTTIDPDWSPDGSQIAFGFVNTSKIGIINADGTGLRYIVPGGSPAWSPVENKIAYIWQGTTENVTFVVEPHKKIYGIVTVNTDGENMTYLANGCFPTWSPDGTKIVYAVSENNYDVPPGGSSSIWVMNSDGSGKTQLTTEEDGICMQPSFSYDGSKIVYLKGATDGQYMKTYGSNEIWVMDNDGSNKHQIYAPGDSWSWISKRSWNKDNKILFVRIPIFPGPGGGIWVINSDGSNSHGPVIQTPSYAYGDPVWSNDGTKVALTRFPSPMGGGDFTPDIFVFFWE